MTMPTTLLSLLTFLCSFLFAAGLMSAASPMKSFFPVLLNYETVKYFNAEDREAKRYDKAMA
ncbi:MAG TPA: hypothetical protein DCS60_02930, partial [Opitutae bacterium]|nr:hypothetical protein [Opitutae bacterium]